MDDHSVLGFLFFTETSFSFSQVLLFVMLPKPLLALWAGAALVVGKTPSGFTPTSNTDLIVLYGQTVAMNGAEVDQAGKNTNCAQELPGRPLTDNSYGQRTDDSYKVSP